MKGRTISHAPAGPAPGAGRVTPLGVLAVAAALAGALVPVWTQDAPFVLVMASHAAVAALLAVSLDLLTGNTGLLSFGHAGWFGLGAYACGLAAKGWSAELLLAVPVALVAALLLSAAVGAILVRQVGKAFAILTLAFSQVLYALVFLFSDVTGGEDGLQGIPVPTFFGREIASQEAWYWLLYGTLVAVLAAAFALRRSPLGCAWLGIRENAERAHFVGMHVGRLKLYAYMASAALAALAGALHVLFNGATSPETLHWFESGKVLMYMVLGGVGTIVGPAVGAVVFTLAEETLSSVTDAWLIYFGALFVFIVIVAPGGLFGLAKPAWRRLARRRGEPQ